MRRFIGALLVLALAMSSAGFAGTWLVEPPPISSFVTEESVIHPFLYVGQSGERLVRVCILPTSDFIDQMQAALLRAIDTFNDLLPTTTNFIPTSDEVPLTVIDYESVALHELLHCAAGIGHSNALTGIDPPSLSTNSLVGDDGVFNLNAGGDGRFGTLDDIRGDDVNTFWFQRASNDPFTVAATVDSTAYSRDLADLPVGHSFPANGNFIVAGLEGFPNLQPVMERTQVVGSETRLLAPDDTVNIRYGMSGLNETVDASDDYTIRLEFVGVTDVGCEVAVRFDSADPAIFAQCSPGAIAIGAGSNHFRLAGTSNILFNSDQDWFFGLDVFADGFESGDTSAWSEVLP